MSLVNVSLKFWSLNTANTLIFSLLKCEWLLHLQNFLEFFSKNTRELYIVLTKTVNIMTTSYLVQLTMFWTTSLCMRLTAQMHQPKVFFYFYFLYNFVGMGGGGTPLNSCWPADQIRYLCKQLHYEYTPIQIYWNFRLQKTENFQIKTDFFFIFLLKT